MDGGGNTPTELHAERPLVLLFYDGYERKALPGVAGMLFSQARRFARLAYKTIRRQQPRTGFYTSFIKLVEALKRANVDVRINDFAAARARPRYPIGVSGYPGALPAVESLPNPRLVGPGIFTSPIEIPGFYDDPRNRAILLHCEWHADVFKPWHEGRIRHWYAGFDVNAFTDARQIEKQRDVLIYDKIYFYRDKYYAEAIEPFIAMLEARGQSYKVLRYGEHHYDDYLAAVRTSRCVAFFAHQETQGMAYQEALASNVPIFAWSEGIWLSPVVEELGRGPVRCTTVPYFDERCGETFTIATMADQWDGFFSRLDAFEPRAYIADALTLEHSAQLYLDAYREIAARADQRGEGALAVTSAGRQNA